MNILKIYKWAENKKFGNRWSRRLGKIEKVCERKTRSPFHTYLVEMYRKPCLYDTQGSVEAEVTLTHLPSDRQWEQEKKRKQGFTIENVHGAPCREPSYSDLYRHRTHSSRTMTPCAIHRTVSTRRHRLHESREIERIRPGAVVVAVGSDGIILYDNSNNNM